MTRDENSPKWRRRKDARPAEIVEAALDAFAERGFAATRLEDVAERAGISKGTLYLYFANKEELFKAVIQQALVPNLALAEARIPSATGTTRELLMEVVGGFLGAIAGSKVSAIPKLIIGEAKNFPEVTEFYSREVAGRGMRIVAAILKRGIERGEVRPLDPALAAPIVAGPLLLLILWKSVLEPHAPLTIDPAAYLKTYADVLLNGLLVQPTPKEG